MDKPEPFQTHFPSPTRKDINALSDEEKIHKIEYHFRSIMETLGLDLNDPSLEMTPYRVAKMYVKEIFSGLNPNEFPRVSFFPHAPQDKKNSSMVLVKASFTSFCEHHFVPMHGRAYVAYLPGTKIIGLSKISRIIRYFSKRPQVQERMTNQIADALSLLLETDDVAVSLVATHYCVIARGVEDDHGHTVTNSLFGKFNSDEAIRKEFFDAISRSND